MKYYEVKFNIAAPEELMDDVRDVLMALVGEAGFESFEETAEGLTGYVQQGAFSQPLLDEQLTMMPFEGVIINYKVGEAEDKDWNEQWETEGFEPIVVNQRCIVHDGRHLDGIQLQDFDISVEIDAKLAFGTGTHATTQMMLATLLEQPLQGKRVLDCGCGTGILGIVALKAGADSCTGYDIDEWSTENTRHNAVINHVIERLEIYLGDASVLKSVEGLFDVVLANINRNILLNDMEAFRQMMAPGALLLLSGFYVADVALLVEKASTLGLSVVGQRTLDDWACLALAGSGSCG